DVDQDAVDRPTTDASDPDTSDPDTSDPDTSDPGTADPRDADVDAAAPATDERRPPDADDPSSAWARGGGHIPRHRRATVEIARVPAGLATAAAWAWRVLLLIVAGAALLWVLVDLYVVTLPVILALILATLCVPPARWLESHGAPRAVAASVVVIG